jgi:hypothetical protein
MTHLYFVPNSLADPTFEAYLKDTHRYLDYRDVRDHVLPNLFASLDEVSKVDVLKGRSFRFTCTNRFDGQHPAIRIQSPVGFVPDLIWIEFPPRHESFRIKHSAQEMHVQGMDMLEHHLRVLLVMGFAHWSPK